MVDGIITKKTFIYNANSLVLDGGIKLDEIKHYLLYWNKILYPLLNGSGPNLDALPHLAYLERTGILSLENVSVNPDELNEIENSPVTSTIQGIPLNLYSSALAKSQIKLAENRLKKGEIWSIAQNGQNLDLPSSNLKETPVLEFALYNCLPTPGAGVSFDEIINFRIKHVKELSHLHKKVETYRSDIAKSDDPKRDIIFAKKEITSLTNDISNLMKKKKWTYHFLNFKNYLESNSILPTLLGGAGGASFLSLSPEEGAFMGYAAGVGLNITQKIIQGQREIPDPLKDYVYLYSAGKRKIT